MPNLASVQQILGPRADPFIIQVNAEIRELNVLINQYNVAEKRSQGEILQRIYLAKLKMDNTHSDLNLGRFPGYKEQIQNKLFKNLRAEFNKSGVQSLLDVAELNPGIKKAPAMTAEFPKILANMEPEKVNLLLEILSAGAAFNKRRLINLYMASEPGYAEYQRFLRNNSIQFLGGNNSKNFKIIPANGASPLILKVENRLGMPKGVEQHLRLHSLQEVFTPVFAERQAYCDIGGHSVARTLVVTEFCSGGDLESHGVQIGRNDAKRIQSALDIYSQMGTILKNMHQEYCSFPDMKNSNWLIDTHGKVRIADTKSFSPIQRNGEVNITENMKKWYGFLSTSYMNPPEFDLPTPFSADKMHSFMLGKNLYQYLSNCPWRYLANNNIVRNYDFSATVFSTEEGIQLKSLIYKMIQPNPADRISVRQALLIFEQIQCGILLKQLNAYNMGDKESEKEQYIATIKTRITAANTLQELGAIKQLLRTKLLEMKQYVLEQAKTECRTLLQELNSYNMGDKEADKNRYLAVVASKVTAASSLEELAAIKQGLRTNLLEAKKYVLEQAKTECRTLLQEFHSYNMGVQEDEKRKYLTNQNNRIDRTNNLNDIGIVKQEINSKLSDLKSYLLIESEKKQCLSILEKMKRFSSGPHDKIGIYINAQLIKIQNATNIQEIKTIRQQLEIQTSNQQFFKQAPPEAGDKNKKTIRPGVEKRH